MRIHRSIRNCALILGLAAATTLALVLLMRHSLPVRAEAGVRYVAPGGIDTNNDCDHSENPCATIQHAVDMARGGDELRVAAGTYTGPHGRPAPLGYSGSTIVTQVVYISKTITLRGGYDTDFVWDPAVFTTTLDAEGQGRVLFLAGEITATVEALFITGGDASGLGGIQSVDGGGGIYVLSATVALSGCHIVNNTSLFGGGVFLYQSSRPILNNNIIRDNVAHYAGGGVYLEASTEVILKDNIVQDNTAYAGGGIGLVSSAHATLLGNIVRENRVIGDSVSLGGGIALALSDDAVLSDNTIQGNAASVNAPSGGSYGGGIYLDQNVNTTLSRNGILSNTADYGGGVIIWHSADATLTGNIILDNVSEFGGGILLWESSDAVLDNSVVADNGVGRAGSGIYIVGSTAHLRHNTLARNKGSSGLDVGEFGGVDSRVVLTNTVLVSHTVGITVTAGNMVTLNGVLWYSNTINYGGEGHIAATNEYIGNPAFAVDGYHLTVASAAIDRGVKAGVNSDIDGEPRPQGMGYDLGADEFPLDWYVYMPLVVRNWPLSAEQRCLGSGGSVTTAMCCRSVDDFPNTCAIGACGCAPQDSHPVRICDCGPGACFDGNECVPVGGEQ